MKIKAKSRFLGHIFERRPGPSQGRCYHEQRMRHHEKLCLKGPDRSKPKQTRLMRDMHEGARGLYKAGLLSEREMSKMDVLCRAPKPTVERRALAEAPDKTKLPRRTSGR